MSIRKRILRLILWGAILTVFLLILVLLFTQTPYFRTIAKRIIISQISKQIQGELTIGSLDGNFYNSLTLNDIAFSDNDKEIITLKEISLEYKLLPLLKRRVSIERIALSGLNVFLQEEDDQWNLQRLFTPEETKESDETVKESKDSPWKIDLDLLTLSGINININTIEKQNSKIPSSIENLQVSLSFALRPDWAKISLFETSYIIKWSDEHLLTVDDITFTARLIEDEITLSDLLLDTDNFVLTASASTSTEFDNFSGQLDFFVQKAEDFAFFFPILNPDSSFRLSSDFQGDRKEVELTLSLQEERGKLALSMFMLNPPYVESDSKPVYEASLVFDELDPSYWLLDESLYLLLNGDIALAGIGFDFPDITFTMSSDLHNSVFHLRNHIDEPVQFDRLSLETELVNNSLHSELKLMIRDLGSVSSEIRIGELSEFGDIVLKGKVENLNLNNLQVLDNPYTDLNFSYGLKSKKLGEEPVFAELAFTPSLYDTLSIETLILQGMYEDEDVTIDTLYCVIDNNILELSGFFSQTEENRADFILHLNNILPLLAFIDLPEERIETQGKLTGSLRGKIDSFAFTGELYLNDTRYGDYYAGVIEKVFSIRKESEHLFLETGMTIDDILLQDIPLESVALSGNWNKDSSSVSLDIVQSSDISLGISADIFTEEDIRIALSRFQLQMSPQMWELEKKRAMITIADNTFSFSDFKLVSGNQSVELDGYASLSESSDFNLIIADLDLAPLAAQLDHIVLSKGILSLAVTLQGSPAEPDISANLVLMDGTWQEMTELGVETSLTYSPEKETVEGEITIEHKNNPYFLIDFLLPVKLTLEEGGEFFKDRDLLVDLQTTEFDLSTLQVFLEDITDLNGILKAQLLLGNTLEDLKTTGSLEVLDASFSVPGLGTSYRNLNLLLTFEEERLNLDRLVVRAGEGKFLGKGHIVINEGFFSQLEDFSDDTISVINLEFNAENFPIISTDALDLSINSKLLIKGSSSEPRFEGNILVNRGRIQLDELTGGTMADSTEKPLLVQAREKQQITEVDPPAEEQKKSFDLENMSGEIALTFPRNVWLRSPDMNIELSGDLNILVAGSDFEVFGTVRPLRGFYALYGKRFQIVSGEITFTGGSDLDPLISLEAVYTFRGSDMTRKHLKLIITGSLEQLDLAFELNNQPIEEADAISYIVLGRSFDELTHGEKTEVSNQALAIGGFLAGRFTGKLTSVLGDVFHLDMIELRSDTAASQIGLEVGKYLTDRLFVSYKRDFSFSDSHEQIYEEILFEYEITRFLFLQAVKGDSKTSGIDIIWRFSWK
jgi:translocation and assembly module TamB